MTTTNQPVIPTLSLGPNGPVVPALGIGTWAWGDTLFWNYGGDYGPLQLQEAFTAAVAAGVNWFDTAEVYGLGESETLLGQFMRQVEQPVHIATKYMPLPWRFNRKAVTDALTASLERLKLDRITLYQVHWPFDFFMRQETLINALADEVHRGRCLSVGVSNYSADQMRVAHQFLAARGVPLAVNQVQYSLLARQIETNGVLQVARELGVTILAYSPLAQGLLTGKYTSATGYQPDGARKLDPRFNPSGLQRITPLLEQLQAIGSKYDRTPAQVALNWLIAQGNIIPIPGAKSAEQVTQNIQALGWSLATDEIQQLDQTSRECGR